MTREEILAKAADAKAEADKLKLEYGEQYAAKEDLDSAGEKAALELASQIEAATLRAERLTKEAGEALKSEAQEQEEKSLEEKSPFLRYMKSGWAGCSADERKEFGTDTFMAGYDHGFNVQLATANPAFSDLPEGAHPVFTDSRVRDALSYFGGVRDAAMITTWPTGSPRVVPRHNSTTAVGRIVTSENTTATEQDYPAFTDITLQPQTWSSDKSVVSRELLQDAVVDVAGRVMDDLMRRLGRVLNRFLTNTQSGSGVPTDANAKPQGLVDAVANAGFRAASATAIAWQELLRLTNEIDVAYALGREDNEGKGLTYGKGRVGWMCHQNVWNHIQQIDAAGVPLFQPRAQSNLSSMMGRTLFGYPVILNNELPSTLAADATPILFGDFSQYECIDIAGSLDVLRQTGDTHGSAYQVGFVAFMRSTGRMLGRAEALTKFRMAAS